MVGQLFLSAASSVHWSALFSMERHASCAPLPGITRLRNNFAIQIIPATVAGKMAVKMVVAVTNLMKRRVHDRQHVHART